MRSSCGQPIAKSTFHSLTRDLSETLSSRNHGFYFSFSIPLVQGQNSKSVSWKSLQFKMRNCVPTACGELSNWALCGWTGEAQQQRSSGEQAGTSKEVRVCSRGELRRWGQRKNTPSFFALDRHSSNHLPKGQGKGFKYVFRVEVAWNSLSD